MKKQGLLAASIAMALVGCGSDSDSSSNPTTFSITAIDGYLANANVLVDSNQDGECDLPQGKTDDKGQANLSLEYRNAVVCIDAVKGQTVDSNRGLVQDGFTLANAGSGAIINPMTNMVNKLLAADSELTLAEAEEQVVTAITGDEGLEVSQALIFGDYIADISEQAEALNLIGEVLVDKSDQDIDTKLKLAQAMAEATQEMIEAGDSLDDYSPIIDIPSGGGDISVTPNTRPKVVGVAEPVKLTLGEAWRPNNIGNKFEDAEGHQMTFTMVAVEVDGDGNVEDNNGLSIDSLTGLITGEPELAGSFVYHIFATDEYDARSYPLTFEVTVLTDNEPPVVDEDELANLQSTMNAWMLTEGELLTDTLEVSTLFNDEDDLKYKVETTLSTATRTGFNALVDDEGRVSFTGLIPRPAAAGAETLIVSVNDGVNSDWVSATLSFPLIDESYTPPADGHPLENQTWHFLEWGSDDGTDSGVNEIDRVWCDSIRLSDGKVYFNQRSLDNLQSCGEADTLESESSYVIKEDIVELTMSWEDEEDGILSEIIHLKIVEDADATMGSGTKMVLMSFVEEDEEHQRLAWYSNKSLAEARINLESDTHDGDNDFPMYLPGIEDGQYELGYVSMSMGLPNSSDQGQYDADIFFDIPGHNITCDDLREFYKQFYISGYDESGNRFYSYSGNSWDGGFECYDKQENGVNYAGIDFDIDENLKVGNVYSFVGIMQFSELQHLEEIKFNMTWKGENN
ncbi:Ig domain-containing protein [Vibrio sp. 10N.247.311.51]|uniref:Ig domain-containing protein n=1 Tax=Vibrio sp. 10N.247.311.51 TaxID=3229996 RepID=UPI003553882E